MYSSINLLHIFRNASKRLLLFVSYEICYIDEFEYAEIDVMFTFPCYTRNTIFGEIWPKKIKHYTKNEVKVTKAVGNCGFGHIFWRNPYGKRYFLCSQKCLFKLKISTWTNLNILNSMVVFTLSMLDRNYLFCAESVQRIKFVVQAEIWYLD